MRAQNLHHAATAVVVRDSLGRVYVHRRTPTKDVYPGRRDFAAGGVIAAGEAPDAAAARELAEELGITDTPLTSLGHGDYRDDHTSYRGFCYVTEWDGPIRWQPEEVVSGEWLTVESLVAAIAADPDDFMPDTVGLLGAWLRQRAADRRPVPEQGWDCVTDVVEGRWIDRRPRRPEVAAALQREVALLGAVADRLPLAVPRPVVVEPDPLCVRHVLVPGEPVEPSALTAADGELMGQFLRVLHATDPAEVPVHMGSAESRAELLATLADFRTRVLPLMPEPARPAGAALLDEVAARPATSLIHGDLGPAHVLAAGRRLSGVIDWADCRIGDPALDLAWLLNGTPAAFADALGAAYGVTPALRGHALAWRRLGPWFEVTYGLDHQDPSAGAAHVGSGLAGLLDRLPRGSTS